MRGRSKYYIMYTEYRSVVSGGGKSFFFFF